MMLWLSQTFSGRVTWDQLKGCKGLSSPDDAATSQDEPAPTGLEGASESRGLSGLLSASLQYSASRGFGSLFSGSVKDSFQTDEVCWDFVVESAGSSPQRSGESVAVSVARGVGAGGGGRGGGVIYTLWRRD